MCIQQVQTHLHHIVNIPLMGQSSGFTHLWFTLSITWPGGQAQPSMHTIGQNIIGLGWHVAGHGDAQVENSCPSIAHSSSIGSHFGQHSPSGTTSRSPSSQTGFKQMTIEQSGIVGMHSGQHCPSGTWSISPSWQTGRRHRMVEQSGTHTGQHSPSGTSCCSPSLHSGKRQDTAEQSGVSPSFTHWGQHCPSGVSILSPGLQSGSAHSTVEQSIIGMSVLRNSTRLFYNNTQWQLTFVQSRYYLTQTAVSM